MNGNSPYEGRLEIRRNGGQWGTVYGTYWSSKHASVACRSLGFSSSVLSPDITTEAFGAGTGPVLYSSVFCNGSEATIFDCPGENKWDSSPDTSARAHCCDVGLYCLPGNFINDNDIYTVFDISIIFISANLALFVHNNMFMNIDFT